MESGILLLDSGGLIRATNLAASQLFGYGADELQGLSFRLLLGPAQADDSGLERFGSPGQEVRAFRKDGSAFPAYLSTLELNDATRNATIVVVRNLSFHREAQSALDEREEQLRSIVETIPDAIITIDEEGAIQFFSAAAERLFGYKAYDVVGQNVRLLMPSPYKEEHDGYLSRYLRTGERRIIGIGRVVVGRRADGSVFPIELHVGEMRPGGRRLFTGFLRDLTQVQRTETRLQDLHAEFLRASRLNMMGRMASMIAHEINQPLTAVTNYVQAARQLAVSSPPDASARVLDALEKAAGQANRAGSIIRRLRDFVSRREAERHPEDLNKAVEEASALAMVGAREQGIRVHFRLQPGLPSVLIDKIQIQQVVLNLVRNAIEAVEGSLRREITIRTSITGQMAEVSIADMGPGLAPEIRGRLFQPFVSTKEHGMGMGLSICREIVEIHGGKLQADNAPGGGCVFCFTVPVASENRDDL
ncbi:MAG: PAS domain S-box protein [Acetobacteraceae bacterium]|nr:PAS domain S-box protein [Acetobacteraceae bacterium]